MKPGEPYRVSDIDLASRLSFFLWSSIPDEELLAAAIKGTLSNRATLEQQVRRMLADPRAQALVDNFAMQWLTLGKLAGVVPDVDAYPEFDENLRDAFRQETRTFIESQLREDRSVIDLVTRELLVRERAARAPLPDSQRVRQPLQARDVHGRRSRRTARPGRHPHGHVVSQPHIARAARPLAARQRARRAASPAAAGRAAAEREQRREERLDAPADGSAPQEPVMRRRVTCAWTRSGSRSNSSTRSESGEPRVTGLRSMRRQRFRMARASRASPDCGKWSPVILDDFARTFTQKLLAYAVGRSLDAHDQPAVRQIARTAAVQGYRWSSIITGIVTSTPFTMSTQSGRSASVRRQADRPRSRRLNAGH